MIIILGANEKASYFYLEAPNVYENGMYDSLMKVVRKHPQNSVIMIERAADEISRYIRFDMEHQVKYWSYNRKEYVHMKQDGELLNYKDQVLDLTRSSRWSQLGMIHLNENVDDKTLSSLLKIKRDLVKLRFQPSKEENRRWEKYSTDGAGTYGYILSKMLDEDFYFDDWNDDWDED